MKAKILMLLAVGIACFLIGWGFMGIVDSREPWRSVVPNLDPADLNSHYVALHNCKFLYIYNGWVTVSNGEGHRSKDSAVYACPNLEGHVLVDLKETKF